MSQPRYERFVPQGQASLLEDAPGWHGAENYRERGPICWKCGGGGVVKQKKRKSQQETAAATTTCLVCDGLGTLPPKGADVKGRLQPGTITRGRRRYGNNTKISEEGPLPFALYDRETSWSRLVERANNGEHVVLEKETLPKEQPTWLPQAGEELCNLVGSWRILQRVGSHRWTTDDLVTAYVASCELPKITHNNDNGFRYLDLGTGNGSVLLMVTWCMIRQEQTNIQCLGIEARTEAVELARRSLTFNLPPTKDSVSTEIRHGDFRDVVQELKEKRDSCFDLITGTPPYFRVDFEVAAAKVETAIIRQGGMPTSIQSAPARCEFRGGIEVYCQAASLLLSNKGRFVVCENWKNHNRVLQSAQESALTVIKIVQIHGKEGREVLFCVYVMKKQEKDEAIQPVVETVTVRDQQGEWTNQYTDTVLKTMSIPAPLK